MTLIFADPEFKKSQFLEQVKIATNGRSIKEIKAGFAYVSAKGVNLLLESIGSAHIEKNSISFIAGISEAITEPRALSILLGRQEIYTKCFVPGNKLGKQAVFSNPKFHPKFMHIVFEDQHEKQLVIISSANLTFSAIGAPSKNYETGAMIKLPTGCKDLGSLTRWWDSVWGKSRAVNNKFIDAYASIRSNVLTDNPDLLNLCEPSEDISSAGCFWIEVGRASGMDRHQIEFPEHLARFFGKVKRARIDLTLKQAGSAFRGRPLSHKTTSFGVDIWRLGMPTTRSGGEVIQNRVVRFNRTSVMNEFETDVTDVGSNYAQAWFDECNKYGHVGRTSGSYSRAYGYL